MKYIFWIGVDKDHVHFLLQSVPVYSPQKIAQLIKSITVKEIFLSHPEVRKKLWGGKFWSGGYFISTVGKHGDEKMLKNYVQNQGADDTYKALCQRQLTLF